MWENVRRRLALMLSVVMLCTSIDSSLLVSAADVTQTQENTQEAAETPAPEVVEEPAEQEQAEPVEMPADEAGQTSGEESQVPAGEEMPAPVEGDFSAYGTAADAVAGDAEEEVILDVPEEAVYEEGEQILDSALEEEIEVNVLSEEANDLAEAQSAENEWVITGLQIGEMGSFPAGISSIQMELSISYSNGNTQRNIWGYSSAFGDGYGNTLLMSIRDANGEEVSNVSNLAAGTYTLTVTSGTITAESNFEVKPVAEMVEGLLVAGQNQIVAGINSYRYYRFVPEADGRYYFNYILNGNYQIFREENGTLFVVGENAVLENQKEYYVGFSVLEPSYASQTITVGLVPEITSIAVTPKKAVYVMGEMPSFACDVTFGYGDRESETREYGMPSSISDAYGNPAAISVQNPEGAEVTDFSKLTPGSYTITCTCGENLTATGTFEIKKVSAAVLGELVLGENSIQAAGNGYYYYRFAPESAGKYYFSGSAIMRTGQEAADGSLSSIKDSNVVELQAGEACYVGFWSWDGTDSSETVTVNPVPAVTSLTLYPNSAHYVAGMPGTVSGSVGIQYADGQEYNYSLGNFDSELSDNYGNKYTISFTDSQGNEVGNSLTELEAGSYTITASCGEVTGSRTIEVCLMDDLLKGTLTEGKNAISIAAGEMGYYKFVPSSTGSYYITVNEFIDISYYVQGTNGNFETADPSKMEAGKNYYIQLDVFETCNAISVVKVEEIEQISVALRKDAYIAGTSGYVYGDITVTYGNGNVKTFTVGRSGVTDEYGHSLRLTLKKVGETVLYGTNLSDLKPGTYQVYCEYDGVTSQEQTIELIDIKNADLPELALGTQTIQVGSFTEPVYYQFTPGETGFYVLDGLQTGGIEHTWYTYSDAGFVECSNDSFSEGQRSNAMSLTGGQTYYVGIATWGENSNTNTLRIRKRPEIEAVQVGSNTLKESYIQGIENSLGLEDDIRDILISFSDETTETLKYSWDEDSYGRMLEIRLMKEGTVVTEDACLNTVGTYQCQIGYGEVWADVASFRVIPLKDAGLLEAEENQETVINAEEETAVFKFTSGKAGTYEIEANVPLRYLDVYDDNLDTMSGIKDDGRYKAYVRLEANKAYYFKSMLPDMVTRLKVTCRPVTLPKKAELRARGTLIAGLDYLDNVITKVTYDNNTTGTVYGEGDDSFGNKFKYAVTDQQGNNWTYGERVKAGTYTVGLQVFRTGSSILEQLEGIETTPITVKVENVQTGTLPVIEKDAWITVTPTGGRQLFAFTAPEKGTYQLEGDVNYYLAEFYRQGDQQLVRAGYAIALEAGETCVIATNGFTAGQFRVAAASEDTPTGDRRTVTLEAGKSYEAQLNDNIKYIDYLFTPTETKSYWIKSSSASYTDTYVTLYCDEKVIDKDDDSADQGDFYLRQTLEAGKTYRYEVRMYNPGVEGDFTVKFEEFQSKDISGIQVIQVGDLLDGAGMSGPYKGLAVEITYADGTIVRQPWQRWGDWSDEYGNRFTCCEEENTEKLPDGSGYKQGFYVEYWKEGETETKIKTSETTVFEIRYMTSVAEELQQGIPVTKNLAAGKTAYFKFKPAEEGYYLISAQAKGVNISVWSSSEAHDTETWYEQGKSERWMSAVYDDYETFWFSCTDDEGNPVDADLTVEIHKMMDITDLTVLTKPEADSILEHSSIYSYEGLTVKASYADGTEETIAAGDTDSSGRDLQYYGTWINDQTFRVYVKLGVYRTYYDVPAKSWDEAPVLKIGEAVQFGEAGNPSAGATFTPETDGKYQIAVTNRTENESYSVAVREKETDELISTVDGTYDLAGGISYKVSLYRLEMNESGEAIGPKPGIFEVTVYAAGECLWEVTEEKAATCTEDGYVKKHCKVHGDDETEVLPAKGHSFGEWTETAAPDCTTEGAKTRTCSNCNETETQAIPALGHVEKTETKEATCTEDGYTRTICTRCNEVLSETIREATGHTFGDKWNVTKEATCTEDGQQTRTCSKCDLVEKWTMPALGHNWKTETKEATCTEAGYTRTTCTDCNETSEENQEALGHSYGQWLVTKAATCTEAGEQVKICSFCQDKQTEVIPALGHTEKTETQEVTCTADGYTRTICETCGAIISQEKINATGHNWNEKRVEPTCTVNGYVRRTCGNCGALEETPLEALGHDWRWVVTKDPTETEKGERQQICSRCNEVQATEEIDATHVHEWVEEKKDATCTEAGYSQMVCNGCQAVQADSRTETAALGHNWGEWTVAAEATCNQEGRNERVCSTCGEKQVEAIPVKAHTWETKVTQEATCTQEGRQSEICTVCDTVKEGSEKTLPMLSHTWAKEMTVDKAANCTEKGSKSIHCTVCGSVLEGSQIEIPALGHDIQQIVTIPATCYAEGQVTNYCKNKGCTLEPGTVTLPKLNHQMVPESWIQANCEEDGLKTYVCSIKGCGRKTYEVMPALGHDYSGAEENYKPTEPERELVIKRCTHNGCDSYQTVRVLPSAEEREFMEVLQTSVQTAGSTTATEEEKDQAIADALAAIDQVDNEVLAGVEADASGAVSGTVLVENLEEQIKSADTSIGVTEIIDADHQNAAMEAVGMAITVAKGLQPQQQMMMLSLMSAENEVPMAAAGDAAYIPSLKLGAGVPGKDPVKGQIYTDKVITAYVKQGEEESKIDSLAAPVTVKGILLPANYGAETKAYLVDADGKEAALKTTVTEGKMDVVIPQLGTLRLRAECEHQWPDEWKMSQAATCTEGGLESQNCTICEKTRTRKTETIYHNFQSEIIKDATCIEEGKVKLTCSACGASETNAIPANNNHTWSEWTVKTPATCSTDGEEARTCSLCSKAEENRVIPRGGEDSEHTALQKEWTTEKEATCAETGTRFKLCTDCGTRVTEDIPKLAHEYGEWKVTKAATCTANGLEERKCVNCDQTETRETGAAGHIFDGAWTVTSAATCTANGVQERKCRNCAQKETQAIPAIGHNYSSAWTTDRASTCTTEGSKSRHCTRCSAVTGVTRIPVTGHRFGGFTVTAAPTVLTAGTETRKCSVCGVSESRATSKLPATMTLTANSLTMKTKQTTTLFKVSGMAKGDYLKSVVSSNASLLRVSNVGRGGTFKLAAQKKTGNVTLTITLASGLSRKVAVKIQKGKVKSTAIKVSARSLTLQKGKKAAVTAVVSPVTSQDKISFKSSNKKVATVSSKGVITAKKAGTAKITVNAGSKKAVITVKVQGVKTTNLTGVPASKTLKRKKKLTLKVKRVPAASEDKITYASSNKKVATITSKGKITAKAPGKTVITVKAGTVVKRFTLTVTK